MKTNRSEGKKKWGWKKTVIVIAIIIAVVTPLQLAVLGWFGGTGPLGYLRDKRMGLKPGNGAEYSFDKIEMLTDSPLEGGNIAILGSSVAQGEHSQKQAVGEYFAARFGANLTKETVGGTTLTDNGSSSYVQRLKNIPTDRSYALFICQLSTNDASKGMPLGVISSGTELQDFDTSTVTGAMEYIIAYAKNTWNCPVVFFTGSHYDSPEYDTMVVRLHELAEKWNVGVLDLWTDEDFNNIDSSLRSLYMSDKIHPTKAGYRDWWGPELEKQLLAYLKESE